MQQRSDENPSTRNQPKRSAGRPNRYAVYFHNQPVFETFSQHTLPRDGFKTSRQIECQGIVKRGVASSIKKSQIPQGTHIYKSKFIDSIKNEDSQDWFEKSRLCIAAWGDKDKWTILTQSPTIQRPSQRMILAIAPMMMAKGLIIYNRDVEQAFTLSKTAINRPFYFTAPPELCYEMGIAKNSIVILNLPLYGAPESGNHWYNTYHKHHTKNLGLIKSSYDPCLLVRNDNEYFGMIGMQIDDTFGLVNSKFAELEEQKINKANIKCKKRDILTIDVPLKFNGGFVTLKQNGQVTLTQETHCKNLRQINIKEVVSKTSTRGVVRSNLTPKDQFVAQRASGSYIGTMCQPEICAALSFAAQAVNPNEDDAKAPKRALKWQIDNSKRGLTFVKLEEDFEVSVFVDSSFANNKDYTSQLGTVIAIKDKNGNTNIVHYNSIKAKMVVRSVLNAELQGLLLGFDIGACIKKTYEILFNRYIPLTVYTDSKSLYDCVIRLGMTLEKRMMIDVMVIRDAYEERELTEIKWITGDTNPADSMTKIKCNDALKDLIDTNMIKVAVKEWVDRPLPKSLND